MQQHRSFCLARMICTFFPPRTAWPGIAQWRRGMAISTLIAAAWIQQAIRAGLLQVEEVSSCVTLLTVKQSILILGCDSDVALGKRVRNTRYRRGELREGRRAGGQERFASGSRRACWSAGQSLSEGGGLGGWRGGPEDDDDVVCWCFQDCPSLTATTPPPSPSRVASI